MRTSISWRGHRQRRSPPPIHYSQWWRSSQTAQVFQIARYIQTSQTIQSAHVLSLAQNMGLWSIPPINRGRRGRRGIAVPVSTDAHHPERNETSRPAQPIGGTLDSAGFVCKRPGHTSPTLSVSMLRGFPAPTGAMVNSQGLPAPGPRSHSEPQGLEAPGYFPVPLWGRAQTAQHQNAPARGVQDRQASVAGTPR